MTRSEAFQRVLDIQSKEEDISISMNFVDEIFNDIESQVCANCKFYDFEDSSEQICNNINNNQLNDDNEQRDTRWYKMMITPDFCCNEWTVM